jgi:hypothetical protein
MRKQIKSQQHRNPNVQVILSQERYYGDGPPKWREGRNKRPCQTSAQAKIERRKAVKRLRRAGKENAAALNLSSRIAACAPKQRCGSGACAECARAWQRWFVIATRNFLKCEPRRFVTVLNPIHVSGKIEPGSECQEQLRSAQDQVSITKKHLSKARRQLTDTQQELVATRNQAALSSRKSKNALDALKQRICECLEEIHNLKETLWKSTRRFEVRLEKLQRINRQLLDRLTPRVIRGSTTLH